MSVNVRNAATSSYSQQGFTLIELMIVVAIIGILATLAISAYHHYTIRAQISDGIAVSAGAKTAASDYYMNYGTWPKDNDKAGIAKDNEITGKYTKKVKIKDNVIEIEFGVDAHKDLQKRKVHLTGVDNNGSVSWTCTGDGVMPPSNLPRVCR